MSSISALVPYPPQIWDQRTLIQESMNVGLIQWNQTIWESGVGDILIGVFLQDKIKSQTESQGLGLRWMNMDCWDLSLWLFQLYKGNWIPSVWKSAALCTSSAGQTLDAWIKTGLVLSSSTGYSGSSIWFQNNSRLFLPQAIAIVSADQSISERHGHQSDSPIRPRLDNPLVVVSYSLPIP